MIKEKKVLGVTLARGGSKSVPRKNIKIIAGKPLIAHTIEQVILSKYIDDYIVSTDDKEIAEISRKYGAKVPFLRPSRLATDKATSASALLHTLDFMEKDTSYDYVVEIMCTNPLKNTEDIDNCISILDKKSADNVIAVNRVLDQHPARIKKIINGRIVDFSMKEPLEARRQDLKPKAFIRSGSIYAMKTNFLRKTRARYGGKNSYPYILPEERVINIDEKNDFKLAEIILGDLKKR